MQDITYLENSLIREELSYDIEKVKAQHDRSKCLLNATQLQVYELAISAVGRKEAKVFFIYGRGGTGKTFLYNTITARLRSERHIVLTVASSG